MSSPTLDKLLGINYPILVAPMFLISNVEMVKAALDSGVTAAIPALNYRTENELRKAIQELKSYSSLPFGINLIVNKSNLKYKGQLKVLVEERVGFVITSLGNPKEVIDMCKPFGIKVFCDVVDLTYALKVQDLGADAVIAVNNRAGGHSGNVSPKQLVTQLSQQLTIPVISAGGIATGDQIKEVMTWGAAGVSVGTIFIACNEAPISQEYKQAMVDYGEKDIVLSTKISGSALTVINTPYVKELGTEASWLERLLLKNKTLKKYAKMFIALRGMKAVEKAAMNATYKTVWCAGPAIEHVKSIRPMREIVSQLTAEFSK